MDSLLECVPNFSEGEEQGTLDAIGDAISGHGGAWLLDVSADPDHQRSVFTLAGHPGRVTEAMADAVEVAIERIDMRRQHGQHPRIGAVDVIPFVPLGDTTMEQCVEGAKGFAALIADRFELPVYLYGDAAPSLPSLARRLADLRRPGFEGLAATMLEPGNRPDFGPPRPHPTAGATAVGVRRPLIAFNIQLSTTDVAVARRIAAFVRERDGGLPAVQALGFYLDSQGCAQLSLNILDNETTPLWRVWETVDGLAQQERVAVTDSELVGLAPVAAFLQVAEHIGVPPGLPLADRLRQAASWLRIRRFEPDMALELRLDALRPAHGR